MNEHKEYNKQRNRTVFNGWGLYSFIQMLQYKCQLYGKDLQIIDERNTSKACSGCGNLQDMPLWKRAYHCDECGLVMDRDENSAVNILTRFLARPGPHTGDPVRCADVFTAIDDVNTFRKAAIYMFQCLNTGVISLSVSFDEALQLASRHGFAGLDLPLHELLPLAEQTSAQEINARFQTAGVRPGGWGLPVEFRGSEEVYQAGLQQLPKYAQLAQALGSLRCSTWIMPFSDSLNYADNMEFHAQRLRPIAQILADYGCHFGLEFVGPQTMRAGHRYEFIHTIDGIFKLSERIGTDNIGLLLDAFHWYTAHATIADLQKLRAEQVVYVHVNDAHAQRSADEQIDNQRMLPAATGIIDIAGFLQAVQGIGYEGPVVVEPFNAELVALPADERVAAVKHSLDAIWAQAGITR